MPMNQVIHLATKVLARWVVITLTEGSLLLVLGSGHTAARLVDAIDYDVALGMK